jgi:hypothetical protein
MKMIRSFVGFHRQWTPDHGVLGGQGCRRYACGAVARREPLVHLVVSRGRLWPTVLSSAQDVARTTPTSVYPSGYPSAGIAWWV